MEGTNDQAKQWITATHKGDLSWFDQFYRENKDPFYKWALGEFNLPYEELKDVYHQAISVFYENLMEGKLNQLNSSVRTYLFGIGKNLLLKRINKKKIENRHLEKVKEHWLFHNNRLPENRKILEKVVSELSAMKEPCQSILRMFYIESMGLEKISEKLEYSSSDVVKTQKSRCIKNLRTKLSEWWKSQNS